MLLAEASLECSLVDIHWFWSMREAYALMGKEECPGHLDKPGRSLLGCCGQWSFLTSEQQTVKGSSSQSRRNRS